MDRKDLKVSPIRAVTSSGWDSEAEEGNDADKCEEEIGVQYVLLAGWVVERPCIGSIWRKGTPAILAGKWSPPPLK